MTLGDGIVHVATWTTLPNVAIIDIVYVCSVCVQYIWHMRGRGKGSKGERTKGICLSVLLCGKGRQYNKLLCHTMQFPTGHELGRGHLYIVRCCTFQWAGKGPLAVKLIIPSDEKHWNDLAITINIK